MDLSWYFSQSGRGAAARLARQLGVKPVVVSRWCTGQKPVPVERCASIEKATGMSVRRWDLRPTDWHCIWPELIGQPGAPDVPSGRVQPAAIADAQH